MLRNRPIRRSQRRRRLRPRRHRLRRRHRPGSRRRRGRLRRTSGPPARPPCRRRRSNPCPLSLGPRPCCCRHHLGRRGRACCSPRALHPRHCRRSGRCLVRRRPGFRRRHLHGLPARCRCRLHRWTRRRCRPSSDCCPFSRHLAWTLGPSPDRAQRGQRLGDHL